MRVLVIPEDFRLDQYILQPVISAMMAALGRPRAKIKVLTDPVLGSVNEALKWDNLDAIIDRYKGMVDLFILIVDRDGDPNRRIRLDQLEQLAGATCLFVAANAWQEVELWALAAHALPWPWAEVRNEPNSKEVYFEPFASSRGLENEPGRGRMTLGREAAARYPRLRQLCPEDIGILERRVGDMLAAQSG